MCDGCEKELTIGGTYGVEIGGMPLGNQRNYDLCRECHSKVVRIVEPFFQL